MCDAKRQIFPPNAESVSKPRDFLYTSLFAKKEEEKKRQRVIVKKEQVLIWYVSIVFYTVAALKYAWIKYDNTRREKAVDIFIVSL